jgi:ABC-type transport system substrate-binding protein
MLLNGELDSASIAEKMLYVQSRNEKAVKDGKVRLIDYDYPGYRYLGWNQKREIFRDRAVRRAFAHAIPLDKIIDKVLLGLARRSTGPFLPGSTACDASIQPIPYDPEKARKILEEAGWKDTNTNGVRDKTIGGKTFELKFDLMIYADSPMYKTIAEIIKEEFRQIGADVQISPLKWALMLEKLDKKEFDASLLGWAMSWKQDPFQIFHSSQADVPSSSNSIGYKNPEVDRMIETLRVTFDRAKQQELYHRIHGLLYEDQPYAFLFCDRGTGGHHARIRNVKFYKIRPCLDHREWISTPEEARR